MQILKNRIVIGVACIILSLIICFAVTPLFNQSISEKTQIVRVVREIKKGEEITAAQVKVVEVGGYNLPEDVVRNPETAIGRYASADFVPGDYIIASKIADEPAAENAYLYSLNGEKQAMSVTVKAFANGLSGKLQSGDIVSVIAPDYRKQGLTVIPPELQYVEVIAVTANSGYDANTGEKGDGDQEKELPSTVTLLVTPEQAKVLAELEADGKLHSRWYTAGTGHPPPGSLRRRRLCWRNCMRPWKKKTGREPQTIPRKPGKAMGNPKTAGPWRKKSGKRRKHCREVGWNRS